MSPRPLLSSCLLCLALATAGGTPGCRDRPVGETAEDALRQLNADRDTGYVLGLQQIHDVGVEPREGGGSLYNLVLDVSETDCHVVSRKNWTSCRIRSYSDLPVHGQCDVSVLVLDHLVQLQSYNCSLRPVPGKEVHMICPDCVSSVALNDSSVVEGVKLSLEKFNKESEQPKDFVLVSVTKASMQWVIGPAFFYNFIIREADCLESTTKLDSCKTDKSNARLGYCSGSHISDELRERKNPIITVQCEIYESVEVRSSPPVGTVVTLPPSSEKTSRPPPAAPNCPGVKRPIHS
ncbi:fetuin-B-like [Denticeps clupeoides]|uniref:fetuin-B-like n=1 Tax=Denticeps clupeoides TaxID=299321 RepID=UPI0010A4FDE5|nr:fetuin-B-like [Denticeps clupeoides]